MMKPVIFFSHSSRDKEVILPIRDRLLQHTGNTIEIFMSSDGSSIPFGRNWLKEIEDALSECKLMFVWMTPNSMKSSWIPFEAGHAYARGIQVVPVGFLGTSLDDLPAPINMLQGFDTPSSASLNNLIAVINKLFDTSFTVDAFNDAFLREEVTQHSPENDPAILDYVTEITCRLGTFDVGSSKARVNRDWLEILRKLLTDHGVPFTTGGESVSGIGFAISRAAPPFMYEGQQRSTEMEIRISIDPLALNDTWMVWAKALPLLYKEEKIDRLCMRVSLTDEWRFAVHGTMIGSRLLSSEVTFDTSKPYRVLAYRNIEFRVEGPGYNEELVLFVKHDNDLPIPLYSLLKLLEDRRVIERKPQVSQSDE